MTWRFSWVATVCALFVLIGVGILVDRFGYVEIRTNSADRAITLSIPDPMLLGVPIAMRWQGHAGMDDRAIGLRLVSSEGVILLGDAALVSGVHYVTVPCTLSPSPVRVEMVDNKTGGILASSAVAVLPPGPDCVQ